MQTNLELFQLPSESFFRVQSVSPSSSKPTIRNQPAVLKADNPDRVYGFGRLKLLNTCNVPKQIDNAKCW